MLDDEERERYLRHVLLKEVGAQGQQKLRDARVLVVGAGGLGAPIIQYLAAVGVGRLTIADDDRVALSNLQRQTIFTTKDVGVRKTDAATAFVARLNPRVEVAASGRIAEADAEAVVAGHDLVVEGVDNFETRHALNRACIAARTTLISAAIGRFEGQVATFKPWAGGGLACYRCLVPEAPPRDARFNCAEEGVLGPLAGIIGSIAALEALKEIVGIGAGLAGRLLIYDALAAEFRTVGLARDPQCPDCRGV